MKLNKNLMLTSMLAISIFISSTSYASNEENINIEINQAALDEMANKVDKNTIFAEVGTGISQNVENSRIQGNKKPIEKKTKEKNKSENPESTENPNVIVKPQTEEDKENNESEKQDEKDTSKDNKDEKDDKEVLEDKEKSDQIDKENDSNKNPIDKNEVPEKQDLSSEGEVSDKIVEEESKSTSPNVESMQRLENIHKDEKAKNRTYSPRANSNGQTLQKLTSKETLTTSFKDKGSNLRLNLANVEDYENSTGKKDSQFIIEPQTIIILIAILAAIFSALYIAIRGKNNKSKNL